MKNKKKDAFKNQKLTDKSISELKQLLEETQTEWMRFKMDFKTGKLKDVHGPQKKRKQIAIIKTIIREKELGER